MKIAIDARSMGSRPSGVGMYLFDFLKELIGYEDMEFVLITDVDASEHMRYFKERGVAVCAMNRAVYRSYSVYAYFSFVQRVLDETAPDVFWEVNTIIPAALKGNFKTVITVHDMFPITHVQYYGRVYGLYFKQGLKKTLKRTDGIIYNSLQSKKTTEEIFKRAAAIPNVNGYIIVKQLEQRPKTEDLDYFLYLGNMEKRKGVDVLLKGYGLYRRGGGRKPLILAGKMQEEEIRLLLEQTMKETKGITYLDYVSEEKKKELFAGCSCFVFPSRAEGFGMPVIEAMEYHKPVLASDLEIYKEVVDNAVMFFPMEGIRDEKTCAVNLARALKSFQPNPGLAAYDAICSRYEAGRLGKKLHDFIAKVGSR